MKLLLSLIITALIILFCWYFFGPFWLIDPPKKTYPPYEKPVEPVSQPYYEPGGKG